MVSETWCSLFHIAKTKWAFLSIFSFRVSSFVMGGSKRAESSLNECFIKVIEWFYFIFCIFSSKSAPDDRDVSPKSKYGSAAARCGSITAPDPRNYRKIEKSQIVGFIVSIDILVVLF